MDHLTSSFPGQAPIREDAGRYLRYMAEFIGFTEADAQAVRRTKSILERHLPEIVTDFYNQLLRYPPTRAFFQRSDGTVDEDYLTLRMRHQRNFWLRTADAMLDDEYARYVDYVGRAHTSRGADPQVYIAERYVIGMVGVVQHAVSKALMHDLEGDEPFRSTAVEAWDKLLMVVLELLSRAYGDEHTAETFEPLVPVDRSDVAALTSRAFAAERRVDAGVPLRELLVGRVDEIPEGDRKIVHLDGLSLGVFHLHGRWHALRNYCLHRGGPVATGAVVGTTITCPWHGFQFNVETGQCLADPMAVLDRYPVVIRDGDLYVLVPEQAPHPCGPGAPPTARARTASRSGAVPEGAGALMEHEFRPTDVAPDKSRLVRLGGRNILVHNVGGTFHATSSECPHAYGPLEDGALDGCIITCRLHGSRFDVSTGEVVTGPATEGLRTYQVEIEGDVGRVVEGASEGVGNAASSSPGRIGGNVTGSPSATSASATAASAGTGPTPGA